jgi:serine/threonine protein phosphatase PrpC
VEEEGEKAVERLVDLANDRGGDDNITVAMIRMTDPELEAGREAGQETLEGPLGEGSPTA